MVADVAPRDASDRLIIFQNRFDTLYRKYQTYSGGEVLFGLPVTEHPELLQVGTQSLSTHPLLILGAHRAPDGLPKNYPWSVNLR